MPNTTITISPTAFEHLLSNLEAALSEEAQRRYILTSAKETLVTKEARIALEEREEARVINKKITEAEIEALVHVSQVVTSAESLVREEQLRYDLGKMLTEIARYRVQFALSIARSATMVVD